MYLTQIKNGSQAESESGWTARLLTWLSRHFYFLSSVFSVSLC
jgi:hypothetical protein